MKVAIVIPNWNGEELIAKCLQSLRDQSFSAQIIVVDNGSVDKSAALVEKRFPDVHLIKLLSNRGFSGGVNIGIKYALDHGADAVALFNNDAVADKNWLKNLVSVLEKNQKTGIVTGKLVRDDRQHIDSTGECYSVWGTPFPRGRNQKDTGTFDTTEEVFAATGGASLYRTTVFNEVGLFDERFFAYYEDVDLSFRAILNSWKIIYTPFSVAYHKVSATSSRLGSFTRYHATKNFYMLYVKNMPFLLFWKYLPLFLLQALRLAASSLLKGGFLAYIKGFVRFLLYLPGVLVSRWRIQKHKKLTAKEVDDWLYKKRPPLIPKL